MTRIEKFGLNRLQTLVQRHPQQTRRRSPGSESRETTVAAAESLEARLLLSAQATPIDDGNAIVGQRADTGDVYLLDSNGVDGFTNEFLYNESSDLSQADIGIGDVDGDDLDDVIIIDPLGTVQVALSGEMESPVPTKWGQISTNVTWSKSLVEDFNDDGFADIALFSSTNAWVVGLSNGTDGFSFSVFGRLSGNVGWDVENTTMGDFNDDGKTDIVILSSNGAVVVGLSDGSKFSFSVFKRVSTNVTWTNMVNGDFNNDNKHDIALFSDTGAWVMLTSTGTSFTSSLATRWSTAVSWDHIFRGDIDDDGMSDIIGFSSSGVWVAAVSNGSTFTNMEIARWSPNVQWDFVNIGDFNGDFKTDIVGRAHHSGDWYVGLGDGMGVATSKWGRWGTNTEWRCGFTAYFTDLTMP